MARNFYVVLGVSRNADPGAIKKAYRRLAREYHPDLSTGPVKAFTDLKEAYDTLSDPALDRGLNRSKRAPSGSVVRGDASRGPFSSGFEPLGRGSRERAEILNPLFSELDAFLGGWVPGFYIECRQRAREKDLYVELMLNQEEARQGGAIPLEVPVERFCRECRGLGHKGGLRSCRNCGGRGSGLEHLEIEVHYPPGVMDGTTQVLPLADAGLPGGVLNILVTIQR